LTYSDRNQSIQVFIRQTLGFFLVALLLLDGLHWFAKIHNQGVRQFVEEPLPGLPAWGIDPSDQAIDGKKRESYGLSNALNC
jgi:hypothetical protein